MIEAETSAEVPAPHTKLVLQISGRLDVPVMICEREIQLRPWIEKTWIRDVVAQRFAHGAEDAISAGFPIMMAMVPGEVRAQVAFAVAAVLRNDDGSCGCIRAQSHVGVAHAAGEAQKQVL